MSDQTITLPDAPAIPGLRFRPCRGVADFPTMYDVSTIAAEADGREVWETQDEFVKRYATLKHFDPTQDSLIAEVDGAMVGFNRVEWWEETDGPLIYFHIGFVLPTWRERGLGRAMIGWAERRLRAIAADHAPERAKLFDTFTVDTQPHLTRLVEAEGYTAVRHGYHMVRATLDDIPDIPMPEGLETRPVTPDQYRAIWDAEVEAFRDHWGSGEVDDTDYALWQAEPQFQPHLWQVAWDGDQVAGMIRNFISQAENERYGRLRGYTENISVRRPWRRRGLARALIARSFQTHKAQGMTEAALGVDTENPNGALQLYESMGFVTVKSQTSYRKALA